MSYKSKFSVTQIIPGKFDNLAISTEYDTDPKKLYPMFLYTPSMKDTNTHYHIKLTPYRARVLHAWLTEYLKDPNGGRS